MIFLPVISILIVGLTILARAWGELKSPSLRFSLAWGLGAAAFMLLSMFMIVTTASFRPVAVLFLTVGIMIYCLFRMRPAPSKFSSWLIFLAASFFLFLIAVWVGSLHPYGDWDSWAFWQVRARFIFEAPERWQSTLMMDYQEKHPWFLPFLTAWGWAVSGTEAFGIPFFFGVATCIAVILLLFGGMGGRGTWAWLAAGCLAAQPSFWWTGTNQYADVWVAYYILAAAVLFVLIDEKRCPMLAACSVGFLLGCASFLKIDGGLGAFSLAIFIVLHSIRRKALRSLCLPVGVGFLVFVPFFILSQMGNERAISLSFQGLLDPDRWQKVASFFFSSIATEGGGIIYSILVAGAVWLFSQKGGEKLLSLAGAVIFYLACIFLFFILTLSPLEWHLHVSVDRLLFEIRPLAIFVVFCILRSVHYEYRRSAH